jgi:hypothetical protein
MTKEQFLQSDYNLVIAKDGEALFFSRASDLLGLISYLKSDSPAKSVAIFDRYVGRSAALLMILLEPTYIFAETISEPGIAVLRDTRVEPEYSRLVPLLMGHESESMCRFEKLALDKTAEQLLIELSR